MTPAFSCSDPFATADPAGWRVLRFVLILGAHLGLLWGGFELAGRPEVRQAAREIMVRLIESPPPAQEVLPPESVPAAPRPQPVRRQVQAPTPQPVLTAEPASPAPATTFAVPPQPPAPPVAPPIEAPPAPPAVTAARFDADYLSNPKPVYPVASRRLGEEGKVLLRVKVSPGGTPLLVEVKQSAGHARLDEAARAAVLLWRFVPARRGEEPIESWVTVPVTFSLQAS